MRRCNLLIS